MLISKNLSSDEVLRWSGPGGIVLYAALLIPIRARIHVGQTKACAKCPEAEGTM